MTFNALVIAYEDSSYDGKKGRVSQETLTCLDAERRKRSLPSNLRLKP